MIAGLSNKKTVTIQAADKDQGVVLGTTKTKRQNKPKLSVNKSVLKKEFPRMTKAVANQVLLIFSRSMFVMFLLQIGYIPISLVTFYCDLCSLALYMCWVIWKILRISALVN